MQMSMTQDLTLPMLVAAKARSHPDLDVLTFEDEGREEIRTYRQLWENSLRVAAALRELGVKPGDKFALLLHNHPEFVESMVAAGILGAVFVPIDARTKAEKLAFMLRDAACRGIVCGPYALESAIRAAEVTPGVDWFCLAGATTVAIPTSFKVRHFGEIYAATPQDLPIVAQGERDPMQIMYTSGTTGDPKGIMIRHGRFVFVAKAGELVFGYSQLDRPYTGLSLTHGNAQFVTLAPALRMGLRVVFSRRFTKSRLWDLMRKYHCTTFSLLGGMATAIYSEPPKPGDADNPVRFVVSAGMPAVIWQDFARRFNVKIFEFYGAMEGGMTVNPIDEGPVGSCGRVAPGQLAKVVDDEGRELPPNTPGELWFRPTDGTLPVVEYINHQHASVEKTAGGWLHSGDVVTMDERGWVFFQYRKGGGIRRNGEFINPAFLEKVVAEHPDVADVAVFGVPSTSGAPGEMSVVVATVPTEGSKLVPASVFAWCREKAESNMVPDFLMVVDELPKTASEKVQPRFLVQMFKDGNGPIFSA